jgi:hypothetical protein
MMCLAFGAGIYFNRDAKEIAAKNSLLGGTL